MIFAATAHPAKMFEAFAVHELFGAAYTVVRVRAPEVRDREPVESFCDQIRRRFPQARFAFNWSSSFKWFNDPNPMAFAELGEMGVKFIFITLGAQHATGYGLSVLLRQMSEQQQHGYIELQKKEWEKGGDFPTRSHHFFSGVPYHHVVGKMYDAARLGKEFCEELPEEKVV